MSEEINIKFYDPEVDKLRKENQQLKEKYLNAVADYETTKSENQRLKQVLDEIREQLKKIEPDLDFEPWSIYKVSGNKLFDLSQILDKVK